MRKLVADLRGIPLGAIDSPLIWQPRKLVSWILTIRCRVDFDSLLITGEQVDGVEHVPGQQASTAVSPTPRSRHHLKTAKIETFLKITKSSVDLAGVKTDLIGRQKEVYLKIDRRLKPSLN